MDRRRMVVTAVAGMLLSAAAARAQVNSSTYVMPLLPEGIDQGLFARMAFICGATPNPSRFNVTVRRADPGAALTLSVGGIPRATVTTTSSGTARFIFRNVDPAGTSLPLDFDPRGATVEVADAGGALLSNDTPEGEHPPGTRIRERSSLVATGAIPGASGRVRLRERRGVRRLDVQIEDVPDGAYGLIVDGTTRGTITASGGRGEIEFSSDADDPDELPLDFDPLGALIQVAQDTTIVLSGRVLADSPGVSVCTPSESTTPFTNAGADPDASGDVRLRTKDDCDRDFRVEVEDLPIGAYDVIVGGTLRGTVDVVDDGGGATKGEIEFESDADDPGDVLLNFDAAGQTVEIRQGATLFLTTTVGESGPGACDAIDVEPDMTNTGVDADADGKARFRQESDCDRDFRVEVEDLAVGSYELVVGGIPRGSIDVVDIGGGDTEGSLRFDTDPDEAGELLLDFDPRGQTVEVRQGGVVLLTVAMPA